MDRYPNLHSIQHCAPPITIREVLACNTSGTQEDGVLCDAAPAIVLEKPACHKGTQRASLSRGLEALRLPKMHHSAIARDFAVEKRVTILAARRNVQFLPEGRWRDTLTSLADIWCLERLGGISITGGCFFPPRNLTILFVAVVAIHNVCEEDGRKRKVYIESAHTYVWCWEVGHQSTTETLTPQLS